jgi:hypothetical protein
MKEGWGYASKSSYEIFTEPRMVIRCPKKFDLSVKIQGHTGFIWFLESWYATDELDKMWGVEIRFIEEESYE